MSYIEKTNKSLEITGRMTEDLKYWFQFTYGKKLVLSEYEIETQLKFVSQFLKKDIAGIDKFIQEMECYNLNLS